MKNRRYKQGFTLMEVLISLAVMAVLVPAILHISLRISALIELGVSRNKITQKVRTFQQNFSAIIYNAGLEMEVVDYGGGLHVQHYNPDTDTWTTGWVRWEQDFYEDDGSRPYPLTHVPDVNFPEQNKIVISEGVFSIKTIGETPMFRLTNGCVWVNIKQGSNWVMEMIKRRGGYQVLAGTSIEQTFRPRNRKELTQ